MGRIAAWCGISYTSAVVLGIASWIYTIVTSGIGGPRAAEQIAIDYAVVGAVYVVITSIVLVLVCAADRPRTVLLRALATTLLIVAAMCGANIIIESTSTQYDGLVSGGALVLIVIAPIVLAPRTAGPTTT